MKHIPLSRGQFALVDDEDFERISKRRWYASFVAGKFYANGSCGRDSKPIPLSHVIFGERLGWGGVIYKNGNPLDCRKDNLSKRIRPSDINHRLCGRCKKEFPISIFKNKGKKYRSYCKKCANEKHLEWCGKNPDKIRAWQVRERIENPLKFRWENIAKRASQKGWGVMSRSQFFAWHSSQKKECSYCGVGEETARILYKFPLAIDRKDNKIGYIIDNVVLACHRCNTVKSCFLSYDEMRFVAQNIFVSKVTAT